MEILDNIDTRAVLCRTGIGYVATVRNEKYMKTVVGLLALAFATGCNQPHVQEKAQPTSSRPRLSVTEEFHLRGECAALAEKMSPVYGLVGIALTSEVLSHYNPETNRCYVEVTVTKNPSYNDPKVPLNCSSLALYDGQTREMLISAHQEGKKSVGTVWVGKRADDPSVTSDGASAEINRLMQGRDNTQEH